MVRFSDDVEIGVYKLLSVFEEVRDLNVDEPILIPELLARIRIHNWIPKSREKELGEIALNEFNRFLSEGDDY